MEAARAQPILDALEAVRKRARRAEDLTEAAEGYVCVMTPAGQLYSQQTARRLAEKEHLILVCGHYEGIDERVMRHADEEISIGDYILTGGELPAKVVMDSVIRLLDGVLRKESTQRESFEEGLLEYPQYSDRGSSEDGSVASETVADQNPEAETGSAQKERTVRQGTALA